MNPLSLLTYYRRHKRSALLLMGLVTLATMGIHTMVGLLDSLTENLDILSGQLTRFSLVHPVTGGALDPTVVSQVRTHPHVAQAIQVQRLYINVPLGLATGSWSILGVFEADIPVLMEICDVRLREGRLPQPRANEVVLSEEIARALELQVGDSIGPSINRDRYGSLPTEMVLVGILESDPWAASGQVPSASLAPSRRPVGRIGRGTGIRLGFASREYLEGHELHSRPSGLIVVPRNGHKVTVDAFLETKIPSARTDVETAARLFAMSDRVRRSFRLVCGVIDCLVAVVVALVVGVINHIALTQRLPDLGLLHALGHRRRRLVQRLTLETAAVAGTGWAIGLALSWLSLAWARTNLYEPSGMELRPLSLTPIWFSAPIPTVVIASAALSIAQVFARLDSVAIIERGKLSTEARRRPRVVKRSSVRPLSSWIFYLRHRCRGVLLVAAVALMISGMTFPMFLTSAMIDAQDPFFLNYLRHVGVVSPKVGRTVDPAVAARIRTHPSVARVLPFTQLGLTISIPPLSITQARIYGVSEQGLPALIDLFGMRLKEGRLPRPRSNEVVLSEALALNRGLRVGNKVGRPVAERDEDGPPEMQDEDMPTEMVISGILASEDVSLGFASREYLESHELYAGWRVNLLVVPAEGRKAELDAWLEEHVASERTSVSTYGSALREEQQSTLVMHLVFAALEGIIAIVAAGALTALNHIFFAQRREEYGILHAVGRGRPWLTLRAASESGSVVATGWLIGAALCIVGLVCAQASVYGPKGLRPGQRLWAKRPAPGLFQPCALAVYAAHPVGRHRRRRGHDCPGARQARPVGCHRRKASMNPLSPMTYYCCHVKSTLLFLAFINLMTLGVGVMVRLVDSIWEELYNIIERR
jgi:ABC-type lipoprotein release transport system permease subunit